MAELAAQRKVINIHRAEMRVYDLEGPVQPEMSWSPLSYDADGNGCYLMRMDPGAETIEHTHEGVEDFLILEGELIEPDGTVFRPGDFVSYAPGSRHSSRTETGCFLIGFDWGKGEKGP
jgi:anti-sigma factor ChrR (cupin superfamily)